MDVINSNYNFEFLPVEIKELGNWFVVNFDKSTKKATGNYFHNLKTYNELDPSDVKNSLATKLLCFSFNNISYIGLDFDAHSKDIIEKAKQIKQINEYVAKYFINKPCYIEKSKGGDGYHIICKVADVSQFQAFNNGETTLTEAKVNGNYCLYMTGKTTQKCEILQPMDAELIQFFIETGNDNAFIEAEAPKDCDFSEINSLEAVTPIYSSNTKTRNWEIMNASELTEFLCNQQKTGEKFSNLYHIKDAWSRYAPDRSRADCQFLGLIHFWRQDRDVAWQIYRNSARYREGYDKETKKRHKQPDYFDRTWKYVCNNAYKIANKYVEPSANYNCDFNISTNTAEAPMTPEQEAQHNEILESLFNESTIASFTDNYLANKDRATRKYLTGINSFDKLTEGDDGRRGFDTGLNVIVAPSGFGKSLFMTQSAEYIAKHNKDATVLYFNLEMDPIRLCKNNLLRHRFLNDFDCEIFDSDLLVDYKTQYNNLCFVPNKVYFYEDIMELVKYTQEHKSEYVVVFIDYFQKIQGKDTKQFFQRREFLDKILMDFKVYANEQQVCFVIASNMAKGQLTDLVDETSGKETGDLLYSTDNFFGIDLDYKYTKEFNYLSKSDKAKASQFLNKAKASKCKLLRFRKFKGRDGDGGGEGLFKLLGPEKTIYTVDTVSAYDMYNYDINFYETVDKDKVIFAPIIEATEPSEPKEAKAKQKQSKKKTVKL